MLEFNPAESTVERTCEQTDINDVLSSVKPDFAPAIYNGTYGFCVTRLSDGVLLEVSQAFLDAIGYQREECLGKSVYEFSVWPNELAREDFITAMKKNEWPSTIVNVICKNGNYKVIRVSGSIVSRNGELCMSSVFRDVTDAEKVESPLTVSENQYQKIFEDSVNGVSIIRLADHVVVNVNSACLALYGYQKEEKEFVLGRSTIEMGIWVHEDQRLQFIDVLKRAGIVDHIEVQLKRRDGSIFDATLSATVMMFDGAPCVLTWQKDETERKRADRLVQENADRYLSIFQTSPDGVSITQIANGRFLNINQSFLDMFGYQESEVVGSTCAELGMWHDLSDRVELVNRLKRVGRSDNFEVLSRKKNGEDIWLSISSSTIDIDGEMCILNYRKDITERKIAEANIKRLAFYDQLTQLPNRTMLYERAKEHLNVSAAKKCYGALLLIDIDNFKSFNDSYGHAMGDALLQAVSHRLHNSIQEKDTVARLGGDEFVIMLNNLSEFENIALEKANAETNKILSALTAVYEIKGVSAQITASIGFTLYGHKDENISPILKRADLAMYGVKGRGRNSTSFFKPEMEIAMLKRAELEKELRSAIEKEQFVLYYQCQNVNNTVVGAEALVRWNHPERGVVSPAEFIPYAEESLLILPLGRLILKMACEQLVAWSRMPSREYLKVSVNVSIAQFQESNFVEQVKKTLEETGANPKNLNLELTENLLASDFHGLLEKMFALKEIGVSFSLDDFGTGYSSLSYLKSLPLDQLKIDQIFVRDALEDPNSAVIVQTIIALAQSLSLNVIAEGVETIEQRNFLEKAGCYVYQGYLYSKPCPVDMFDQI